MLGLPDLDAMPFFSADVGGQRVDTFVLVYDQSDLGDSPLRFKQILSRIRTEVRNYPRFQHLYRPSLIPLGDQQWTLDEQFDVEFHVRHIALPKPGDWRQFCIQVARLHARPLDQTRPLWEINVIEGLDNTPWSGQGHFALVCKIHHELMVASHSQDLVWTLHDEVDFVADDSPPGGDSLFSPLLGLLRGGSDRLLQPLVSPLESAVSCTRQIWSDLMPVVSFYTNALFGLRTVPYTRFNTNISSFRVWEACSFPKEAIETLLERYPEVTAEDLMVTVIGGAMRRYLSDKTELGNRSLCALVPVHEAPGDSNFETLAFCALDLATRYDDPVKRLLTISRCRQQQEQAIGALEMQQILSSPLQRMAHTNDLLHRIQANEAAGSPVANTALISLPQQQPLTLLGAPMVYFSGVPEITNGLGLVHLTSQCGEQLNLAITSCREMLPDPGYYRQCIYLSLQELSDAEAPTVQDLSQ